MIYLDYAAASPIDEKVLTTYFNIAKKYYGNPNSNHYMGIEAKKLIEDSTNRIADLLNILPEEIIYTSGASEANNLAIKGIAKRYKSIGKHIIVSALEHSSIIASCSTLQDEGFDIEILPVLKNGLVNIDELRNMIRQDTILVSITSVDSEIGLKQPIEEIGIILKEYPNCHFHSDASQAMGKVKIDYKDVDLITIAPHKFYGMNGIGLLIKKKNTSLRPIINGGRSTTVYRAGTPDTASIVALKESIEIAMNNYSERYNHVSKLYNKIIDNFKSYKDVKINNRENSSPFIINISIKGIKSNDFVKVLEENDIIVSAKTSCCPIESPSKLVYALTEDKSLASSSVRISLSHLTTEEEIDEFLTIFDKCIKEYNNEKE